MKERESLITGGLVAFMIILWMGFFFHSSPKFAGSLIGGILAIIGATLMLVPFLYVIIKRVKWLKKRTTKFISMRTMLAIHIYAGIIGPILVLLHTGHKFESPLGILLTTMTIIVVISGYTGRYLLKYISQEIREKKNLLQEANTNYQATMVELAANPDLAANLSSFSSSISRILASLFFRISNTPLTSLPLTTRALRLSDTIADLEFAIKSHQKFKTWFNKWLKLHITLSFILLALMILHIWGAIHFGLRWSESWKPTTLDPQTEQTTTPTPTPTPANHLTHHTTPIHA